MSAVVALALLGFQPRLSVLAVGQGEIAPSVIGALSLAEPIRSQKLAEESPPWVLVDLDPRTKLARPKNLPFVDTPARESAFLNAMGSPESRSVRLGDLPDEARQLVADRFRSIGIKGIADDTVLHLEGQQRYWVEAERGTAIHQVTMGKSAVASRSELTSVDPPATDDPVPWHVANPQMGLTYHFGAVRTAEEALVEADKINRYLMAIVHENARKKVQWLRNAVQDPLPRTYSEIPEKDRKTMEDNFVSSFRAHGFASEDAARTAWQRRKGFRSDFAWMASVAVRRPDGSVEIHAVEVSRVRPD